ncbi:MAG TPA: hypothetical protein VM657_10200 [Sphingomonas sp.]|nr:hypothetical protein [Sphingomonas sp.]
MHKWLASFVAPAFISFVITLFINARVDKIKVQRELIGASFEGVRENIDVAVKAAARYYPLDAAGRTPLLEADIWLADRELRFAIPALLDSVSSTTKRKLEDLTEAFDDFVSELTGGSFQAKNAKPDLVHLRRIASAGSDLRARLSEVRHEEIRAALEKSPLSKLINYLNEPMGLS